MSLSREIAAALDPVVFARRVRITPDQWQAEVLRSPSDRILLNCSRQSGKSVMMALIAVWTVIFRPGSLVLLVSKSQRQSQELFKKTMGFYRRLNRPVSAEAENMLTLELANGSRIVSLPGNQATVRGYSDVALIAIDEAAQVPDDLYAAIRPMLAVSAGRLIAASTPYGKRGWWAGAWFGDEDWERFEVPATLCPRISAAFLEQERRTLAPWWFEQEYLCRFMDAETAAFSAEDIEAAFDEGITTWGCLGTEWAVN